MPTYVYKCPVCNHVFEKVQRITAEPVCDCPKCEKPQPCKRQIVGGAFHLKGTGWYETDYKKR